MRPMLMRTLGASVLLADVAVLLTGCGASRVGALPPVVPDGTDGVTGDAVPDTFWMPDRYDFELCAGWTPRFASGTTASLTRGNVWEVVTPSEYVLDKTNATQQGETAADAANGSGRSMARERGCARLSQAYPNPLTTTAAIEYGVGTTARVTVRVYTLGGRLVRTLLDRDLVSGSFGRLCWDGRDDAGYACARGVYFCRIEAGGFMDSRKLMLLR